MIKNKLINHYLDKSFECYSSFRNKEAIEYVYENDRVADEAAEKFNVT